MQLYIKLHNGKML